jgi:peptidyl-prolyl isomerase G (cyclophilin G)
MCELAVTGNDDLPSAYRTSVFGRVVSGMEHVMHIGSTPVDEKDRPISPINIVHCGELEMRRAPVKKVRSPSPTSSVASAQSFESLAKTKKRSARHESGSEDDDRRRRRQERKEKKRGKASRSKSEKSRKPKEETEEELDAR